MRRTAVLLALAACAPEEEPDDRTCALAEGWAPAGREADTARALLPDALRWWALHVVRRGDPDVPEDRWLADLRATTARLRKGATPLDARLGACAPGHPPEPDLVEVACPERCLARVPGHPDGPFATALAHAAERGRWAAWVALAEGRADALQREDALRDVLTGLQVAGTLDPYLIPADPTSAALVAAWTAARAVGTAQTWDRIADAVETCEAARAEACPVGTPGAVVEEQGLAFVPLPPGTSWMGSAEADPLRDDDEDLRAVTLTRGVLFGVREVDEGTWLDVMGEPGETPFACGPDCAAAGVSWNAAAIFTVRLSARAGLDPCYACEGDGFDAHCVPVPGAPYDCPGYRLPTEAEWAYAARAGGLERGSLPGGGTVIAVDEGLGCEGVPSVYGRDPVTEHAWSCLDGADPGAHPTGARRANPWGIHDLIGNVWEWCHEPYGPLDAGPLTDPVGPADGYNRVLRGGSWLDPAANLRLGNRNRATPDDPSPVHGLRVVRTLRADELP